MQRSETDGANVLGPKALSAVRWRWPLGQIEEEPGAAGLTGGGAGEAWLVDETAR